jgi:uncharacterized protein Yka (UPF0111/DUF47 family)
MEVVNMRYDIVARLMGMRDEEIQEMKEGFIEMLRYNEEKKAQLEGTIDFSEVEYDSDEWNEYEEVIYSINDCKSFIDAIEDFYENYDYYFDFDVEECDNE